MKTTPLIQAPGQAEQAVHRKNLKAANQTFIRMGADLSSVEIKGMDGNTVAKVEIKDGRPLITGSDLAVQRACGAMMKALLETAPVKCEWLRFLTKDNSLECVVVRQPGNRISIEKSRPCAFPPPPLEN